jgi:hypothetical protein
MCSVPEVPLHKAVTLSLTQQPSCRWLPAVPPDSPWTYQHGARAGGAHCTGAGGGALRGLGIGVTRVPHRFQQPSYLAMHIMNGYHSRHEY